MENASKALLIAGGILLAILTLSLVIYMTTVTSSMADAQDARTLANQINTFNKEYEAYNKRKMYGTDVITVINKAIDYNGGLDADETDHFIDMIFTINDSFTTTKKTVITYSNGTSDTNITKEGISSLDAGTYQLKTVEGTNKMNINIINFFNGETNDPPVVTNNYSNRVEEIYQYCALTNFKRAIFSCTNVIYNADTGRIQSMTFEQQ